MAKRYLERFFPLVDAIAETFGRNCEVVLHDLSNPASSIIKIANGHVTGREIGGPITDLGLRFLKEAEDGSKPDFLIGYQTKSKKGADLKSSTVFIRNDKDKIVGCICINIDITPYLSLGKVLEQICETPMNVDSHPLETGGEISERFEGNVDDLINHLIDSSFQQSGKPVPYMEKEDKLLIIKQLKENGFFLIKGASKKAAEALNVSLSTIYKYLEEV